MVPVPVTFATKITLIRILLIPVFVGFAIEYTQGVNAAGRPDERLRHIAVAIFAIAALSDALDGWIARRFNQRSRLGVILDPLADKLLVLSAVGVVSFTAWPVRLPLWFVIIIFAREIFSTAGAFVIKHLAGKVHIEPHWTGKVSTFLALCTLTLVLLCHTPLLPWAAALAAFFACISGAIYTLSAAQQIQAADHEHPNP